MVYICIIYTIYIIYIIYACIYIHIYYIYIHTHTMEYYSDIKKNDKMPFAATRVDLEIIILGEVSQKEQDIL